jgi:hypothetical protein
MADLTITAASVLPGTEAEGAQFEQGLAAVAITAGQLVYKDNNGLYRLADNNDTSELLSVIAGVSLHGCAAGQPLRVQTAGPYTVGATVASGTVYVLSATAGGIAPVADLATGNRTTIVGVGTNGSTTRMTLRPWASRAVRP